MQFRKIVGIGVFVMAAVIVFPGSAPAQSVTRVFPPVPVEQQYVRPLAGPLFDDGFVKVWDGWFKEGGPEGSRYTIITTGNDCCKGRTPNLLPGFEIRFLEPDGSIAWVKDVGFTMGILPAGLAQVCGSAGCLPVQQSSNYFYPYKTGNIYVRFIRPLQWWEEWQVELHKQITFSYTTPPDKNPVIFVPGIAASKLAIEGEEVWPGPISSLGSAWPRLTLDPSRPQNSVQATDVLREFYGGFLDWVEASGFPPYRWNPQQPCDLSQNAPGAQQPTLFIYPYDWRRAGTTNADGLARYVQCVQQFHPGKKIDVVAHSMGGLITRRLLLDHPAEANAVRQVITIGSPFLGAPKAIATMYSGLFVGPEWFPIRAGTIQELSEYFPAVHELMPSRLIFPPPGMPGSPMRSAFRAGPEDPEVVTDLTYPQFVSKLDSRFRSNPGTTNQTLHDSSGQDDWRSDASGIRFVHFVGRQSDQRTIVRVTVARYPWLGPEGYSVAEQVDLLHGVGDGTVPAKSATFDFGTYLAPGARIEYVDGDAESVEHAKLPSHPAVMMGVVSLLAQASSLARHSPVTTAAASQPTPTALPASDWAVYLNLSNVPAPLVTRDNYSSDPSGPSGGRVPWATILKTGDRSWNMVLRRSLYYKVTFVSDGKPFGMSYAYGPGNETPGIVRRFLDVNIPAGKPVMLEMTGGPVLFSAAYDDDGDGWYETAITPTVDVPFDLLNDVDAPSVTVEGKPIATITAADPSGVRALYISLDGGAFTRSNDAAVTIDTAGHSSLSAFADDEAGNRSSLAEIILQQTSAETAIDLVAPAQLEVGETVSVQARLVSDEHPLAGQEIVVSAGGVTSHVTTDAQGFAHVPFGPDAAGTATLQFTFAGSPEYLPATASATIAVVPAATTLAIDAPAAWTYQQTATVRATLSRSRDGQPLGGRMVIFTLDTSSATAITDASGVATVPMTAAVEPGARSLTASFAGDGAASPSSRGLMVTVSRLKSALVVADTLLLATGVDQSVSVMLLDPDTNAPLPGRTIAFAIGSIAAAATTDATGAARATVRLDSDARLLAVTFAGDAFTEPARQSASVVAFEPSRFVIWGGNAAPLSVGQRVTLMAPDWARQVSGGAYDAGASFKGVAAEAASLLAPCQGIVGTTPVMPGCWSAKPGDLDVPAHAQRVSALVATAIRADHGTIFGNVVAIAVIDIDEPAAPNVRTGVVRALIH